MNLDFDEFFSGYAASYEGYEATDVARFVASPCLFLLKGDVQLLSSDADVLKFLETGLESYRANGVARWSAAVETARMLGPHHGEADIAWEMMDAGGAVVMAFRTTYTLIRQNDLWKIVAIVRHDVD